MKVSEQLKQAKALIADERHWCQISAVQGRAGLVYRSARIFGIRISWPFPQCWTARCSFNALRVVTGMVEGHWEMPAAELLNRYAKERHFIHYLALNDAVGITTHADVMRMWDWAIEQAESQEMWEELQQRPTSEGDSRTPRGNDEPARQIVQHQKK